MPLAKLVNPKILRTVLAAVLGIVILAIVLLRPFWGLMDDASYVIFLLPDIHKNGLLTTAWTYGIGDLDWGMFRPTLPILAYLVYSPGLLFGPMATYLWNAALSAAVLFAYARLMARIVEIPTEWILLVCACFFYQYDWFQYPSLQEKLILASGAWFIWICWSWDRLGARSRVPHLLAAFVFGALTKASILIHFSVGLWIFALRDGGVKALLRPRRLTETVILTLAVFALALAFREISRHSDYTGQYSIHKVVPNLLSKEGLLFGAAIALAATAAAWRKEIYLDNQILFAPLVGILAFLAIFLPWGIQGYIQSNVGPLFAAAVALALHQIFPAKLRPIWLGLFLLVAPLMSAYRSYSMFERLGDVGKVVAMVPELERRGIDEIWMPCLEGADSMYHYSRRLLGARVAFRFPKTYSPIEGKTFLFDESACKLPISLDAVQGCSQEVLFQSRWSRSFRMVHLRCGPH